MRTRSHPVSPGGLVSLDDVPAPPTRRRNTRSVSAQPQDAAEPGSGAAEATKPKPTPKTRKTRAKSTRGKKTNRRPTKSAEPEQKDATGIAAEQVNQDDIETVSLPQFPPPNDEDLLAAETLSSTQPMQDLENVAQTILEKEPPVGTPIANIGEAAMDIDHSNVLVMQGVKHIPPFGSEQLVALYGHIADQFVAEQSHEDHEMHDEHSSLIPSIEDPQHSIFTSVETGDAENGTGNSTASHREWIPQLDISLLGIVDPFCRKLQSTGVYDNLLRFRNWVAQRLYWNQPDGCIHLPSPINPIIHGFSDDQENVYDQIVLIPILPGRNFARRNAQTSPSRATSNTHRASRGSQVLAPQKATPIRRSYSSISQTRRTEASGRINRTLYRLPDLVTHDDSDEDAPVQDRHQVVDTEENVSVIANPTTPEPARPMTPMTAPPAANVGDTAATPNSSPSWSRWIFNSVSRRWTNIRERLVPRPSAGTLSAAEADETVEADEAIDQIATPTKSAETNKAPSTAPKLPTETFVPLPTRSTYRRRVSTFLPHDIDPDRPRRPRRISTTDRPVAAPKPLRKPTTPAAELGYDLFPRGYDEQLLNKWFARGTNPRHAQPSQATNDMQATNKASISAPNQVVPTTNETASALTEDQSLKRKREEPEKIPNPKGCSYGLSEEFFEFTDAEWEEEEKRVAALKANESAQPAAKKQRVDASQPRRRATTRPSSSNAHPSTLSPARRPGFVPNRRGTYAAPDLSPIESSGLLSGVDSTPTREASSEGPTSAQYDHDSTDHEALQQQREIKAKQPRGPNPRPSGTYQTPSPSFVLPRETHWARKYRCGGNIEESSDEVPLPSMTPPPRTRNTFETPYFPPWPSPGFSPSPPHPTIWDFWADLGEKEVWLRKLHLALAEYGQRVGGVVTNVLQGCHPIFASRYMNCYAKGPGGFRTNLWYTCQYWKIRLEYGSVKEVPKWITYSDGTFRKYSNTEDTPLYRVRRDGTLAWHHYYLSLDYTRATQDQICTDNNQFQVFANPNDVPDSGQTAPTVTQNLELPAATTPEREPSHTDTDIDIDIDADADGPSPLTRARNKAEQFKPKTPSRLREAHPFSSSIASAATASPSFLGVATGTPLNFGATLQTPSNLGALNSSHAFYSDPMSIDSIEPATPADDANWLRETCPTGEIAKLCWPEPASLAETLGIDPAIAEFVNQHVNPEKDAEAVAAWQTMFEEFQRGELEI